MSKKKIARVEGTVFSDAEVMARLALASDPARLARMTERALALDGLIAEWLYKDVRTDLDRNAIVALRAIVGCLSDGDADGMQEIAEKAAAVRDVKTSEAHRALNRRVSEAVEAIAEHLRDERDESKYGDARRAMTAVTSVLAHHPDAFPVVTNALNEAAREGAYPAVREALRKCAQNGKPPLGPVLTAWGCPKSTVNKAQKNVRNE